MTPERESQTIVDATLEEPALRPVSPPAPLAEKEVYVFPASQEQSRYWILDQLDGASTASNMAIAFRLQGPAQDHLVERALTALILRHEALRTTYRMVDGELSQVITDDSDFDFKVYDLRGLPVSERPAQAEALIVEHGRVQVDLGRGPMLFVCLIHLTDTEHFLAFTLHHIACDGWSNGILVRDFAELYAAAAEGRVAALPELPFQFADFTVWQQEWLESPAAKAALAFWKEHVGREMPAIDLPTDCPRSAKKNAPGHIESMLLPAALDARLKEYCRHHNVTMHQVLLAAFEGLLARYTHQPEYLLGSTIANRTQPGMENVVGRFAHPQILLADVSGNPTFRQLLARVSDWSARAYSHQDLPFSRLMEEFQMDQVGATSQFLQVYFVYQKAFMQPQDSGVLKIVPRPSVSGGVNFDMLVSIVDRAEGPRLQIEYNTILFTRKRIRGLIRMYARVLEAVMDNDTLAVADLPLQTLEEEQEMTAAGNSQRQKKDTSGSIPEWFDQQAEAHPDAEAIVGGEGRITWKDLQNKSRRYAVALSKLGIVAGNTVALRMEASAGSAAAALALMRLGAAVIPVPVGTAQTGLDQIESELRPDMILISEGASRGRELSAVKSAQHKSAPNSGPGSNVPADADRPGTASQNPAETAAASEYSGARNAGDSPAIAVPDGNLNAGAAKAADAFTLHPANISKASSTPGAASNATARSSQASASGEAAAAARTNVVTLHDVEFLSCAILPAHRYPYPPPQQTAWLGVRVEDGHLETAPATHEETLAAMVATAQALNLRRGDTVLAFDAPSSASAWTDLLIAMLSGARLVHTRETFPSAFNDLVDGERASFAFATPAEWLSLMHSGWTGHPRLQKVTRGAHASPAALHTIAEGFPAAWFLAVSPVLPGPFSVETLTASDQDGAPLAALPGESLMIRDEAGHPVPSMVHGELVVQRKGTMHRTGAMATYSPESGFRLVDGGERLVKLHGHRIHLRDIEDLLEEHPQVATAEAALLQREDGTNGLVAYVNAYEGSALPLQDISAFLKSRAPAHLAATEVIPVPGMLRRIDGSVDASYQRRLEPGQIVTPAGKADFLGPRDELEEKLVAIWETVLGVEGIGVKTSFFSLGGYSLMIVRLFARINKSMGTSLPITTIFNAPTIEQLADVLRGRTIYSSLVPIQIKGTKPPFFLVHSYLLYEGLRSVLGEDQPFYGLRELDRDADMTLDLRVEAYAKEIRRVQPHGPYSVGGWCAAGPLAVSTARKLAEAGEKVDLLVLFDSWRPGYAAEVASTHSDNPEMNLRARLRRKWRFHQARLARMSTGQKISYFGAATAHKLRSMRDHFYIRNWGLAQQLFTRFNLPLPDFMHNVSLTTMHAVKLYRGTPFPGRITLIRATEAHYIPGADISCGWGSLAREGVRVLWAPGDHESMFVEPNLPVLGTLLKGVLSNPYQSE